LAGEILENSEKLDLLHVPFKGSADTMTALMGNHIDFFIDGVGLELVKSGKAKALVTYASVRHPELPDVPTPKEAGFDLALPFEGFWGLAVPAGTPDDVMKKLAKATEEILAEPQTQERFHRISVSASWKDGDAYAKDLEKSRAYYSELLKTIKMSDD
jgi:tripartite-type tricarboxylate transporter receptor subunit TctC